jgi:hypothetical protein
LCGVSKKPNYRERDRTNMHMLEKMDILTAALGDKELVDEIMLALSEQQAHEILDYIARCWDIAFTEQED